MKKVLLAFLALTIWSYSTKAQQKDVRVHDPVMIKQGDTYYMFSTGFGISMATSKDLKKWKYLGATFKKIPDWTQDVVPGFRGHMWAPDISFHDGQYYLYYSVSAFAKNTSAIGLATSPTLNPEDDNYEWTDHGIVIQSVPGRDLWNAIDPNLIEDENGNPWLAFGSFWEGLKMVQLYPNRKKMAEPQKWITIARRTRSDSIPDARPGDAALEAPFIFKKDSMYYLFLSWDYCCRGENSTYKVVVGRSKDVAGPYMDREGKSLYHGGGTLVVEGNENWAGVGHNSTYTFDGRDYLIVHAYDLKDDGHAKLKIGEIQWDNEGWPTISEDFLTKKVLLEE